MLKYRELNRDQRHSIRSIWMALWNKKHVPSMEEAWYHVITDFHQYEGGLLISEEIKLLEGLVIERGLSEEYLATLRGIVIPQGPGVHVSELDDNDALVLMLTATSEEREQALRFVLGE